jgi:hypothetical protein
MKSSSRLALVCLVGAVWLVDVRGRGVVLAAPWTPQPCYFSSQQSHRPLAFAVAGGFGSSKKGKKTKSKTTNTVVAPPPQPLEMDTPEGRMGHIKARIQAADLSPMASLTMLEGGANQELALDVDPNAICVVDNLLGADVIESLRQEAESLLPTMVPSQSTRWDESTQSVVPYEKHQVLSMQIEGGAQGYAAPPRLVEYVVSLTTQLSAKLNALLPDIYHLSGGEQTNKLAVCLGDGSHYDKHIDNGGGEDRRKLTALLYLQPPDWQHTGDYPHESETDDARGGYFRAYDVPSQGQVTSMAPRGDRLLLFWSDSLVHDVSPSYAPNGEADRRWALTVWLVVQKDGVIRTTNAEVADRHFGTG